MDYTMFAQLIQNVGFPIVVCGCMAYYIILKDKQHKEEIQQYTDKLDKVTDALNANTTVIAELRALIETKESSRQ